MHPRETRLAALLAPLHLAAAPLLALPLPILLIYLAAPAYMLHQVEEHAGDRFRLSINALLGREALTPRAVFLINVPLVWGLNLAAFLAASAWSPGWGLAAPYAMLVNALVHLAAAARLRRPNPGLWTALVLFLPLSLAALAVSGGTRPQHLAALLAALLLHGGLVALALRQARRP